MLRIDARSSRELQAVILALKNADREVTKQIRAATRGSILGEWKKGLAERAQTDLDKRILVDTARVTVSNQNVKLTSAASVKKFSGGASPNELGKAYEFGALNKTPTTYTATSKKGKKYKVTRYSRAQLPVHNKSGRVAYPTAQELIPRFASLWVQTAVRTMAELTEKR